MRGTDSVQDSSFTVSKLEDFVIHRSSAREVRLQLNEAPPRLNGLLDTIYADSGRDSIAPVKLMLALLVQVFYTVRLEECCANR